MSKNKEIFALVLIDLITIGAATFITAYLYVLFGSPSLKSGEMFSLLSVLYLFWLGLFIFAGLYRSWYRISIFDEIVQLFQTVAIGSVFLLLFISVETIRAHALTPTKLLVLGHGFILLFSVATGRMALRYFQRRLLLSGIGRKKAVIIGWNPAAIDLYEKIKKYPALGYDVVGFIKPSESMPETSDSKQGLSTYDRIKKDFEKITQQEINPALYPEDKYVLGTDHELSGIIREHNIREALIALNSRHHEFLIRILDSIEELRINIKIIPDLYDIISGQARTTQIYGIPLIELEPEIMPIWEQNTKRLIDIFIAFTGLALTLPFWIFVALAVKIDSRGPVFYRQIRVGKDGKKFKIIKFRTMVANAEKGTGAVWAQKNDPRITLIGNLLRKTRIDELPQLINVLQGQMSMVGPRPERPSFVDQLKNEIPLYAHRLRVKPGLTGWAQVKHKYDETIDDVKMKVKYDLFYIENMSLRMDLKIMLLTAYVIFARKGQ